MQYSRNRLFATHFVMLSSVLLQVGDKLKVLVIKVDKENGRIGVSTRELEQAPEDFVKLSRKEFSDRAEGQAAAWRNNLLLTLKVLQEPCVPPSYLVHCSVCL
jgi:predicted RNA-binding protein with RPS1 domain